MGKSLAVGFGEYSQQEAFQVKVYEVETGRETATFPGPRGGVNDLAFHPDGRHLAVAGSEVVEVWDVVRPQEGPRAPGAFEVGLRRRVSAPTGNGWPPAAGTARSSSGTRPPARRS